MIDAFDTAKTILRTTTLYRELKQVESEYCGDFMGKTAKRDYLNFVESSWASLNPNRCPITGFSFFKTE